MLPEQHLLSAMRGEQSVAGVCRAAEITEAEFRRERDAYLRRRLPPADASWQAAVTAPVDIRRDQHGIPHILAATTPDLYFGLGVAMAQDRLWQMDCFRRRGQGRLAELLGPDYLQSDIMHRTLDLPQIAAQEVRRLDFATAATLAAFVAGINRAIEAAGADLPIEFLLLAYQPEPWTVADVIVSQRAIWWSLSGRLVSLLAGEAASLLPAGPLRDAFLTPEFPDERIVESQHGAPAAPTGSDEGATGSNNWAVGRRRSRSGAGILGSDPHQRFALPTNRYECRLQGPEDDALGATWVGAPGLMFGRNRRIAWGLTNSNASVRDLYREVVRPDDAHSYQDGATWRPFAERQSAIAVRGQPPHQLTVRTTVRGPIVNHLLPSSAGDEAPPLSLRWVGQEHLDDTRAMLAVSRAQTWEQFRRALRDWALPVYNWGYADVDGHIGYQCAARLPVRGRVVYGLREANNPQDQWHGSIPFEHLPSQYDPERGFIASANNAPVDDAYPYGIYGAFASGARAVRIREVLAGSRDFDDAACVALQNDTLSPRARRLVPHLLRHLASLDEPAIQTFCHQLASWDYCYDLTATAPVFFELFFQHWKRRVAEERFPDHLLPLVQEQGGVAGRLIAADDLPWFHGDKLAALAECARLAVAGVRDSFGADPARWAWGAVHRIHLRHPLSTEAVRDVFDVGPRGVAGTLGTIRNTGSGGSPPVGVDAGAEYRLVADLSLTAGVMATQSLGQSGQPGSSFYADQFDDWVAGRYHRLDFDLPVGDVTGSLQLHPSTG